MEKSSLLKKMKYEGTSFLEAISKGNEIFYLTLLTLYVAIYFILKIAWRSNVEQGIEMFRYGILGIVMWGAAVYFFVVIANWKDLWKKNIPLIVVAICLVGLTWLFSVKMSTNLYGVVMDAFFCIMAYKKDYKKILRCYLGVAVFMLVIAGIGVAAGFTFNLEKPENLSPGHSLGIVYPNTWGYLLFLGMMIIWYLYLRFKPIISLGVFWICAAFDYFYISCRTIAGIMVVFPVLAWCIDYLEERADRKAVESIDSDGDENRTKKRGIARYLVIIIPFLVLVFMLVLSNQYEWVHKHFYYNWARNLAMRFVQNGIYFKTFGYPLVGNPYRSNVLNYVNVNDEFIQVDILDSSFATYIIMRGMLWLTYTLVWICIAHWKGLKKRDYAIPFLGFIILMFALMERPGLEMWYNFILLYPLAKVQSKPGTARVLEFGKEPDVSLDKILSTKTETLDGGNTSDSNLESTSDSDTVLADDQTDD